MFRGWIENSIDWNASFTCRSRVPITKANQNKIKATNQSLLNKSNWLIISPHYSHSISVTNSTAEASSKRVCILFLAILISIT